MLHDKAKVTDGGIFGGVFRDARDPGGEGGRFRFAASVFAESATRDAGTSLRGERALPFSRIFPQIPSQQIIGR
jgi:hypothetical protein